MTNYNFDWVSDQYDASRGMPPQVTDRICRWVLSRLPADPAIAEIGVGSGRIALPFIQQNVRYTGFDVSEHMTGLLREKLGGDLRRAQIHLADITEELPVEAASQDAVMAVHILHLVDAEKALQQVRRMLKPHGALVWGFEWHDDHAPRQKIRKYFRLVAEEIGDAQWRDFTVPAARQLLADWGAHASRHTVAAWTTTETCRKALDDIRNRVQSFTWHLDDAVLAEGVRQTEAWAAKEFGDLDRPFPMEKQFLVDWYQF